MQEYPRPPDGFPLTAPDIPRSSPARFWLGWVVWALCCVWMPAGQGADQPIRYVLDLRKPSSHFVLVTMTVPAPLPAVEIRFPAWNNLYQMRDFVRNVRGLGARCDGSGLRLERLDRNTWQSGRQPCSRLEVRYAVRANQESPFSSALNRQHAFLNFALLLFFLPQERGRSVQLKFLLPTQWKVATLLEPEGGEFKAPDYDSLADSPAEAGEFQDYHYTQGGAEYGVVVHADPSSYSADRLLASIEKITATETALMREVPFPRYTFILHFQRRGGWGGMEHRYGTAISLPASSLDRHWEWLEATLAHEFFHLWNVKRIRPQALEPIDYIRGNDTRDLWFCEGVTSYYQELVLLRAGLIPRQTFYERLAAEIGHLEERPARLVQSAEQSGRDAWLEKDRNYNRPARSISYYNKGALLGLLLDLGMRHASHDQHGLDDLMRRLNEDFAHRGRFYTQADLRDLVAQLAPGWAEREAFFRDYVVGTRELNYDTYLGYAGLHLLPRRRGDKTVYRLEELPHPSPDQLQVREGWLEGKTDN